MTKRSWLFALAVLVLVLATSVGLANAKATGTISVSDSTTAAASAGMSSHFTATGCGFRANDVSYYLVVRGPGLYTTNLTYWVDHFLSERFLTRQLRVRYLAGLCAIRFSAAAW